MLLVKEKIRLWLKPRIETDEATRYYPSSDSTSNGFSGVTTESNLTLDNSEPCPASINKDDLSKWMTQSSSGMGMQIIFNKRTLRRQSGFIFRC